MTNYKYDVVYSKKFKKSLKKITKQNKDIDILLDVIDKLAYKQELDITYNNHKLINYTKGGEYWECHLGGRKSDWLLIYQYDDDELILLMVDTGSHSELFGK
ncbi:MAG: type II toxin-antitoxin system YafQ family toxin [Bacilli bacterium]|nr:type II toxin-antitoxin system YafQ family toxin [Bacilli bacterium]